MFLDLHFGFAMSGANRLKSIGSVKLGLLKSNAAIFVDKKTHMRVVVCEIPGPLCQADIIIPTECFDNKGLPHCLEHLIFMGSESFPFRGYLDKLANLCVAQGTNAGIDGDHTACCALGKRPPPPFAGLSRPCATSQINGLAVTMSRFVTRNSAVTQIHRGRSR